jgi:hypothetical protein
MPYAPMAGLACGDSDGIRVEPGKLVTLGTVAC